MKKNTSNLIVDIQNNFISNLKQLSLSLKRARFLIALTLYCTVSSAQNGNPSTPIVNELDTYLTSLKSSDLNKHHYLESLIYNLQPSIYFFSGEVKTYGEKPNTLYTDINFIQDAENPNILKENIEIIILKIETTNQKIDFSKLLNYGDLKYVYIVSKKDLTDQNVVNMIQNYDGNYSIIYKTLKEE